MKMCSAFARHVSSVSLFVPDYFKNRPTTSSIFSYYDINTSFDILPQLWLKTPGWGYFYALILGFQCLLHKPDLVIGRHLPSCLIAAILRIPVVFETHAPISNDGFLLNLLFQSLIRCRSFQTLVVITHNLANHYRCTYPSLSGKIQILPDAANPIPASIQPVILPTDRRRTQIGYTGHLYKGKGSHLVLSLAHALPEYDFHIVGGTPAELKAWTTLSLPSNLTLHGHKPHSSISSYLLAFDILLLPNAHVVEGHNSTTDIGSWTSPLKLFEYMSACKPILCSDAPVLGEIANHGSNMLVCRYHVLHDWISAIHLLHTDHSLRDHLSRQALRDFKSFYTWDRRASMCLQSVSTKLGPFSAFSHLS